MPMHVSGQAPAAGRVIVSCSVVPSRVYHCTFLPPIFLALHFLQARLVLAAVFAARLDPHYLSHFLWP